MDNPTRASNEIAGHSSSLGGDGKVDTFWQATNKDLGNWWQVDLERNIDIEQIKLIFPEEANFGYKIETLDIDNKWKLIIDQSQTKSADRIHIENIKMKIEGRFLKITFTKLPIGKSASLSEIIVLALLQNSFFAIKSA